MDELREHAASLINPRLRRPRPPRRPRCKPSPRCSSRTSPCAPRRPRSASPRSPSTSQASPATRRNEPGRLERDRRAGERTRPGPMRDRFLAALLTLAVFAAGFGAGIWAERHRPLPPPPGAFMGEFGARPGRGPCAGTPVNRAQLSEQIEKLRPEMESFRARMHGDLRRVRPRHGAGPHAGAEGRLREEVQARRGFGPPPEIVADDEQPSRTSRSSSSCSGPSARWPSSS